MDSRENIKPTDEITITTTYGELARVYAVLGSASCGKLLAGEDIWRKCQSIFDPDQKIYDAIIPDSDVRVMCYATYQKEWLDALFPQETETESQRKIRELRETIEKAQRQIQELEGE